MMKYDVVMGLEIHAQLNTRTKIFCGCKNEYKAKPNSNCCHVCLGYPNVVPRLNKAAVEKTILAGLVVGCKINETTFFERKHYFYPDLASGFQTSQLRKPICVGGGINGKRLNRIHLEEDAGKLIHDDLRSETKVDYNRAGTPLIEIVTEPDFHSAQEVTDFLRELRSRLIFAGVSTCHMERGEMRCDVNISLKPKGQTKLGNRVEIKNINSFKFIERAIKYEINRQEGLLDDGETVTVETRKWDEDKGITSSMREKEVATDYRYFACPDVPAIAIGKIDMEIPMLAHEYRERFTSEYGLSEYDADILTRSKIITDYYLECVSLLNEPKKVSNWITTHVFKVMVDDEPPISASHLTTIIGLVESKAVTGNVAVKLFEDVIATGKSPNEIIKEQGLTETVNNETILKILKQLKAEKPQLMVDWQKDRTKVTQFLIGQIMKETKGKAKPDTSKRFVEEVFG